MNYLLVFVLIVFVILLTTNTESFTEAFGLSGYTKPVPSIRMDDPRPDLSGYREVEAVVNNDMVDDFVIQTNEEIFKRTKMYTYIIETTKIKHYVGEEKELFECMFMVIKKDGFSFGFSVVASFEVENGKTRLVSLRNQPLDAQAPSDVTPFIESSEGKEFVDYKLVKEVALPTKSEFDKAKNKFQ